jgi:hypothetical protein
VLVCSSFTVVYSPKSCCPCITECKCLHPTRHVVLPGVRVVHLILAFVVCKSIRHGCMPIVSPHTQPFSERLRPPQRSRSRSKGLGLTLILCVPVRINAIRNEELWSHPHSLCAGANKCNAKQSRSKGFDPTLILQATTRPGPHALHSASV